MSHRHIYLRAGCSAQKISRVYVLLADLPSEVAAPVTRWWCRRPHLWPRQRRRTAGRPG